MPIDQNDKTFLTGVTDKLITGLKPGADKEDEQNKDFLLHLYDALWKNMQSKENRLWTFLSLYGAAVGLVFAGGQVSALASADLLAVVVVMVLSTWAVLIIINANWWYYRNQLIVSRIEKKYPKAVKGIVPKTYYENPTYRFDQLLRGSVMVLSLLMLLLYSKTMWAYHSPESINTIQSLAIIVLLYVLFMLSVGHCLRLHESIIADYFSAKKDILTDAGEIDDSGTVDLFESEIKTRKSLNFRPYVFLLLLTVAGLFDLILTFIGVATGWLLSIVILQVLILILFLLQAQVYRQPIKYCDLLSIKGGLASGTNVSESIESMKDKMKLRDNDKHFRRLCNSQRYIVSLILVSGLLATAAIYSANPKLHEDWNGTKTASSMEVGEQINKMQQDFQSLQKSYNKLQQNDVQKQKQIVDEKLESYQTREDANKRFVTREELNKLPDHQDKTPKQ